MGPGKETNLVPEGPSFATDSTPCADLRHVCGACGFRWPERAAYDELVLKVAHLESQLAALRQPPKVTVRGPLVFVCDDCNATPCTCPDPVADLAVERAAHDVTKAEHELSLVDGRTSYLRAIEERNASEAAHAETRRELDVLSEGIICATRSFVDVVKERDASVAREAETWRMVDALVDGVGRAPGRLPSYIQEPRDALLAARAERGK